MDFKYCFNEIVSLEHKCKIKIKVGNEQGEESERECGETVKVSKDSFWNLKQHIARKHDNVLRKDVATNAGYNIIN